MKKIKILIASCFVVAVMFALTACQPTIVLSRYLDVDAATLAFSLKSDGLFTMFSKGDSPEDWDDYVFDEKNQVVVDRQWEDRICDIKKVVVNKNVSSIGSYAFYNASSLEELVIGPDVTSIGENAFKNCYNLSKITIDKSNTCFVIKDNCLIEVATGKLIRATDASSIKIDSGVFSIEDSAFYGLNSLKTVDLSALPVSEIPEDTFKECSALTTVKLPSTLTAISNNAFFRCVKLSDVNLGECSSLKTIAANAFFGCSALKSVTIPESVSSIERLAFSKCDSLETVVVNNKGSFSIGSNAFYESDNIKKVYFNGATGLNKLNRASYLGYLTATAYKCSYGSVERNISVYIATDVYNAEELGSYLVGESAAYTKLETTESFDGVEYIAYQSNR